MSGSPGHLFALALFSAIGVSHAIRPAGWRLYVEWLAAQGTPGVMLYASLHALPGAMLIALAGTSGWTAILLTFCGAALALKGALYAFAPEFGRRQMQRGVAGSPRAWSAAGFMFLVFAGVAAWGLIA